LACQHVNLTQLGDDLFGLVTLPGHVRLHPFWSSDQHKGWTTSKGADHTGPIEKQRDFRSHVHAPLTLFELTKWRAQHKFRANRMTTSKRS
ncbi:MAG: hypothetical protein ACKOD3_14445, partial [Phenylobacterium sp.]